LAERSRAFAPPYPLRGYGRANASVRSISVDAVSVDAVSSSAGSGVETPTEEEREQRQTPIEQDQPWTISVPPGLYFVSLSGGQFSTQDGGSGEAAYYFGVLVDPERERAIVPTWPFHARCAGSGPDADGGLP
jgi:hypothetical protein